jgi:Family of unknown function (DUF6152)
VLTLGDYRSAAAHSENLLIQNGAPITMRKIVHLALTACAALAAIDPALADPRLSAECLKMDSLRATARDTKLLADLFEARARDVGVVTEGKYFARFDAEKTITLSGTVKEFQWSAPRAGIILNVVNGEAQPATWIVELNSAPAGLLRSGWTSKTLTPGMPITLTIRPLLDGSNGGQFLTATLPDGRLMDGTVAVVIQTRLQSLRDQAAAADRELAEFLQSSSCGR